MYTLTNVSFTEWRKSPFAVSRNAVKGSIIDKFLASIDFACYKDTSGLQQTASKIYRIMDSTVFICEQNWEISIYIYTRKYKKQGTVLN